MPYPCLGNEITDADKFLQKKVVHRYGNYLFGSFARLTCSYAKGWRMTRQVCTCFVRIPLYLLHLWDWDILLLHYNIIVNFRWAGV